MLPPQLCCSSLPGRSRRKGRTPTGGLEPVAGWGCVRGLSPPGHRGGGRGGEQEPSRKSPSTSSRDRTSRYARHPFHRSPPQHQNRLNLVTDFRRTFHTRGGPSNVMPWGSCLRPGLRSGDDLMHLSPLKLFPRGCEFRYSSSVVSVARSLATRDAIKILLPWQGKGTLAPQLDTSSPGTAKLLSLSLEASRKVREKKAP